MNKAFEQIALIEQLIAAAFISDEGALMGSCANSAISEENLRFITATCRNILSSNRAEQRQAHTGAVAFGDRTLVFRQAEGGVFMAYLDSPVNEEVLDWLFQQIEPILLPVGIYFKIDPNQKPLK